MCKLQPTGNITKVETDRNSFGIKKFRVVVSSSLTLAMWKVSIEIKEELLFQNRLLKLR